MVEATKEAKVSKPDHGNPAEGLSPHESVINARTGSEATVESGTGPVLQVTPGGGLSEMTKVYNKDLRARDEKELEKRGSVGGTHAVSVNFEGPMMVEVDGRDGEVKSGSYTGSFVKEIKIRPLTAKEEEELIPGAIPVGTPTRGPAAGTGTTTSRGPR